MKNREKIDLNSIHSKYATRKNISINYYDKCLNHNQSYDDQYTFNPLMSKI